MKQKVTQIEEAVLRILLDFEVPSPKAEKIAKHAAERARRALTPPLLRTKIRIEDRVNSQGDILIHIRKDASEANPYEILDRFLARAKYKGTWELQPALGGINPKIVTYKARPIQETAPKTKGSPEKKEKAILEAFNSLSREEQEKLIRSMQK